MNIIRTVKLKTLDGTFDSFDEKEKFVLSLFNNVHDCSTYGVIRLLLSERDIEIFHYDEITSMLFCSYHEVWHDMSVKFNLTVGEIKK